MPETRWPQCAHNGVQRVVERRHPRRRSLRPLPAPRSRRARGAHARRGTRDAHHVRRRNRAGRPARRQRAVHEPPPPRASPKGSCTRRSVSSFGAVSVPHSTTRRRRVTPSLLPSVDGARKIAIFWVLPAGRGRFRPCPSTDARHGRRLRRRRRHPAELWILDWFGHHLGSGWSGSLGHEHVLAQPQHARVQRVVGTGRRRPRALSGVLGSDVLAFNVIYIGAWTCPAGSRICSRATSPGRPPVRWSPGSCTRSRRRDSPTTDTPTRDGVLVPLVLLVLVRFFEAPSLALRWRGRAHDGTPRCSTSYYGLMVFVALTVLVPGMVIWTWRRANDRGSSPGSRSPPSSVPSSSSRWRGSTRPAAGSPLPA